MDGTHLYGVEVDVPSAVIHGHTQSMFFWADSHLQPALAYEAAAYDALLALHRVYGCLVFDQTVHNLHLCRSLVLRLLPVANRGTRLARLVIAASRRHDVPSATLLLCAQQLLDDLTPALPLRSAFFQH
jgi:hypothetical protein